MFSRNSSAIVDIEFLNGNNNQKFVKELSILFPCSVEVQVFHFLPPYCKNELDLAAALCNQRLEKMNLCWDEGVIPYSELPKYLSQLENYKVLVESKEKKKFLDRYLDDVTIIDDLPDFNDMYHYKHFCTVHQGYNENCASLRALLMFMFLEKQFKFFVSYDTPDYN